MELGKPYRVLVYCTDFTPQQSGYVHAFTQLIRNMADHGVRVDVVTSYELLQDATEFVYPNVNVFRYHPKLAVWGLGLVYQTVQTVRYLLQLDIQNDYDMLLVETGDNAYLIAALPQQLLNKTAVRFHSTSDTEYLIHSKQRKYRIKYWCWNLLSAHRLRYVAATSSYHLQFVQDYLGFTQEYTSYHKLVNAIKNIPEANVVANNTQRSFLMLGRMDTEGYKQKGYDVLLEALNQCSSLFKQHGSIFTIIGQGQFFKTVQNYIQSHQLDFVKLIAACSHEEVKQHLQQSDVVVLPSRYEGVSMFALEALAYQNAVVFTQTGGLLDMVDHNGVGVSVGDVQLLVKALQSMLELDDEGLRQFKNQSRIICQQNFSPAKQWEQVEQLLIQIRNQQ